SAADFGTGAGGLEVLHHPPQRFFHAEQLMREQPELAVFALLGFPLAAPAQHVPQVLMAGPAHLAGPLGDHLFQEGAEGPLPMPRLMLLGESRQRLKELSVCASAITLETHKTPLVRPAASPGGASNGKNRSLSG